MSVIKYKNKGSEIRLKEQNGEVIGELTHHASMAITRGRKQILRYGSTLPTRPDVGGLYFAGERELKDVYDGVYYVNFGRNKKKINVPRAVGDSFTQSGGRIENKHLVGYSAFSTGLIANSDQAKMRLKTNSKGAMMVRVNYFNSTREKIGTADVKCYNSYLSDIPGVASCAFIEVHFSGFNLYSIEIYARNSKGIRGLLTWDGKSWISVLLPNGLQLLSRNGQHKYINNRFLPVPKEYIQCSLTYENKLLKIHAANYPQSVIEGLEFRLLFFKRSKRWKGEKIVSNYICNSKFSYSSQSGTSFFDFVGFSKKGKGATGPLTTTVMLDKNKAIHIDFVCKFSTTAARLNSMTLPVGVGKSGDANSFQFTSQGAASRVFFLNGWRNQTHIFKHAFRTKHSGSCKRFSRFGLQVYDSTFTSNIMEFIIMENGVVQIKNAP